MAARDLITAMISNNHMFRPTAVEVMYHCLFWPPDKQLAFFQVENSSYLAVYCIHVFMGIQVANHCMAVWVNMTVVCLASFVDINLLST